MKYRLKTILRLLEKFKGDQIYGLKNKEHAIYHSVYDASYFEGKRCL